MKIIERSPISGQVGSPSLGDRITGLWRHGWSWSQDYAAQDLLSAQLSRFLDNSNTLIRNAALPNLYLPIPCTLIGPSGVRVYYTSGLKGIYRARGDVWAELDSRNRRYVSSHPNLIQHVALMGRAMNEYLIENSINLEQVETVLFLGQPGVHIEAFEPAVRLLQVDDLERYVASLSLEKRSLDSDEMERVVELLTSSRPRARDKTVRQELGLSSQETLGVGFLRMRPMQWLVTGVLIFLCLISIIIVAFVFLNS